MRRRALMDPNYKLLRSFRTWRCIVSLVKGPTAYYVCLDEMDMEAKTEEEALRRYNDCVEAECSTTR